MRLHRVLVLALALAFAARTSAAGVPDPGPFSTCPTFITLVGQYEGVSDPLGAFTVIVRDFAMNPMPGSVVVVDFNQAQDVQLSSAASPGNTVNCAARQVLAVTDATGTARFAIRGGSRAGPATTFGSTVRIYLDGALCATIPVSTPDLDGQNGVGAGDLAMFLQDFFSQANPTRSDFSHDGFVGGGDLAFWLQIFLNSGSAISGPACP